MAKSTPATKVLDALKIPYALHTYEYDPAAKQIGVQAALELGVDPEVVLKTLMLEVDGKAACVLVPSNSEVSMKKVAAVFGAKHAKMMLPAEAEKQTGYKVGGISPLGRRRSSPVAVDESALQHAKVFLNGGQRGLQICIAPKDLVLALAAEVADLLAD